MLLFILVLCQQLIRALAWSSVMVVSPDWQKSCTVQIDCVSFRVQKWVLYITHSGQCIHVCSDSCLGSAYGASVSFMFHDISASVCALVRSSNCLVQFIEYFIFQVLIYIFWLAGAGLVKIVSCYSSLHIFAYILSLCLSACLLHVSHWCLYGALRRAQFRRHSEEHLLSTMTIKKGDARRGH